MKENIRRDRLLLLSCSDVKVPGPYVMRALDRYDGPAYRMLRNHRKAGHPMPYMIILSAKYKTITWNDLIEVYDQPMTEERANQLMYEEYKWAGQYVRLMFRDAEKHLCISGGLYLDVFRYWLSLPLGQDLNCVDGGIGMKLHALRVFLDEMKEEKDATPLLDLI